MKNIWFDFTNWMKNKNYCWRFKLFIMTPIIILLLIIDWATKAWAVDNLSVIGSKSFIPGFLKFGYTINNGSAYGTMADHPKLVIAIASIVTIICLFIFIVSSNKMIITTFAIIFGGSFGNLLARSWAPNGSGVVDFLIWDFKGAGSYIFNMADLFVNVGIGFAILTIILYLVNFVLNVFLRKKDFATYEEIEGLRQEIEDNKKIIENSFWKTPLKKWLAESKVKKAENIELKAKIKLVKQKLKNGK